MSCCGGVKLITTMEDSYQLFPCYLGDATPPKIMRLTSPRITQISGDEAVIGGIVPRADSFRAEYVFNPFAIVSFKAINFNGVEDSTLLSRIQLQSSISTFDTYSASVPNGYSQSNDTYNIDAQLFATNGRLYYDLSKYATSQLVLTAINRSPANYVYLRIRIEIYSRGENNHYQSTDTVKTPHGTHHAATSK